MKTDEKQYILAYDYAVFTESEIQDGFEQDSFNVGDKFFLVTEVLRVEKPKATVVDASNEVP